jgi:hypothetical protein
MAEAGRGAKIYVLDSGIRITHQNFGNRASHFDNRDVSEFCNDETAV